MFEVLIATGNSHKVHEIQAILAGLAVHWRTTRDWPGETEVEENGTTYSENSRIKAYAWHHRTGLWTVADDSGLEIEALDGRPGLNSARYAPTNAGRIQRVLDEMKDIPFESRRARFVCAATLAGPEGKLIETFGQLHGTIGFGVRGEGGFGYDPIFIPDGYQGKHLAELSEDTKNSISHRAHAMAELRPLLEKLAAKAD